MSIMFLCSIAHSALCFCAFLRFSTCAGDGFGRNGHILARGLMRPPRAGGAGAFVRLGTGHRATAAAALTGRGRFRRRRGRRGALVDGHGPRPAHAISQQTAHAMAEDRPDGGPADSLTSAYLLLV